MLQSAFNTLLVATLAVALQGWPASGRAADPAEVWEGQPYHINAVLAVDAPGHLAAQLETQLPAYLKDRVNTAIGIIWRLKIDVATGPLRQKLLRDVDSFATGDIADAPADEDKRLLLVVRATPWGYQLAAREFDRYVERWGATIRRTTRQRDALPEQLFSLVEQAIAPLAHVRPDSNDPQLVIFDLRGSDLPRSGPDFTWAEAGDVFQPILRRTTRDGLLIPNGAVVVPWTYLEVVKGADESQTTGRIRSATQRPLAARRGRTEQVAIGLRAEPGDSQVRLESRIDADKPLVGYEVLAQNMDEKPMRSLGISNDVGEATITPGQSAVQMLYVKSDGVFLARLPVVPGATGQVRVPLPDDDVRQRVAAKLAAFREDMIDLVAHRNIFMARVRQEIAEKNFDRARQLLEDLEELPGRTQFNLELERTAESQHTDDLQVQRRIDLLFAQTRTALGKFLDPQPLSELHEELRQAESLQKQVDKKEEKKAS